MRIYETQWLGYNEASQKTASCTVAQDSLL